MLEEISSHLLTEWMAYYELEPFGGELLDSHLASFRAMMASTKENVQDPQKFRLWKKVSEIGKKFDPLAYYNELKSWAGGKKKE